MDRPPGTRSLERLAENIGAATIELTPDKLQEIDGEGITVQEARYPESTQRMFDR